MTDNTDFESANDSETAGQTLRPMEALDSDDVKNDDGDNVVDPPDHWYEADRSYDRPRGEVGGGESLDEKLDAEVPDEAAAPPADDAATGDTVELTDDQVDHLNPDDHGTDAGQVSGSPEDGEAFYPVVE